MVRRTPTQSLSQSSHKQRDSNGEYEKTYPGIWIPNYSVVDGYPVRHIWVAARCTNPALGC